MLHPKDDPTRDLLDLRLVYDYDAFDRDTGKPQKWRYEAWYCSEDRIVYSIKSGPMGGRKNFQKAEYQCVRPGELWQISWLEETGTIVSMTVDLVRKTVTSMIAFSRGHWDHNTLAHGDKRNPDDLARWRSLAKVGGGQMDRVMLHETATFTEVAKGPGDLEPIDLNAPTL
ncbi:Calycin-like protein [Zopfochytrium polystomum]|nr:Calycin-like protein [Zopfochytrium polystomum]